MKISEFIDGGKLCPHTISDNEITFELSEECWFDVLVSDAPESLKVTVCGERIKAYINQGLIVSFDNVNFKAYPFEKTDDATYFTTLQNIPKTVRISIVYPYGRDSLDKLLCDTRNVPHISVRILERGFRSLPVFEFGNDVNKITHYIIAGEDCSETPGIIAVDEMIRMLCFDKAFASRVLKRCNIKIIPLASPFSSAKTGSASYTTLDGKCLYAASTWTAENPPPETALIREEVTDLLKAKRLGIFLTMHSWQALYNCSEMDALLTAGNNKLSPARAKRTEKLAKDLMRDVPTGYFGGLSEKIWHPGLARDHLLAAHNFTSFRIEVSSYNQGIDAMRETGRRLLKNIVKARDLQHLYGE